MAKIISTLLIAIFFLSSCKSNKEYNDVSEELKSVNTIIANDNERTFLNLNSQLNSMVDLGYISKPKTYNKSIAS